MARKQYNGEAIKRMAMLFQPHGTAHYNYLIEKGYRELVEAAEFIKTGKDMSFKWLVENQFFEVAAFANAVRGDKNAFRWLMQNQSPFWAATANAANKDQQAMEWLIAHNFTVYADLARSIIDWEKFDNDDFSGYYKSPFG